MTFTQRGQWVPTVEQEYHEWLQRADDPATNNFVDDFGALRIHDYAPSDLTGPPSSPGPGSAPGEYRPGVPPRSRRARLGTLRAPATGDSSTRGPGAVKPSCLSTDRGEAA